MSWFFKGDQTWVPYSAADSAAIEQAHTAFTTTDGPNLFTLNPTYSIDFTKSVQFRSDDPTRWRAVKRGTGGAGSSKGAGRGAGRRTGAKRRVEEADEDDDGEAEYLEDEDDGEEDDEDEAYEEEEEEDEDDVPKKRGKQRPPALKRAAAKKTAPSPLAPPAKAPSPPASPSSSSASSNPKGLTDAAAVRRVKALEEEKASIIADYEKEIEGLHAELVGQRTEVEESKRRMQGKEEELKAVREELEELRHDHEVLLQTLSTATTLIGKRGKGGAEPPALNIGRPQPATASTSTGVKRRREEGKEEEGERKEVKQKRVDDDATQLVSQLSPTLAMDDVPSNPHPSGFDARPRAQSNAAFSVFNPTHALLASPPRTPFRAQLDRHLINPATLSHPHRPICCLTNSRDELVIGFTGGRIELWNVRSFHQTGIVEADPAKAKSLTSKREDLDDKGRGESHNIHCLAAFSMKGERWLLAGKGRRLILYRLLESEEEERGGVEERRSVDFGAGCYVSCLCVMREGWVAVGLAGAGSAIQVLDLAWVISSSRTPTVSLCTLQVRTNELRKLIQLNDGRLALAGCSSLQQPTDTVERGAVELWTLPDPPSSALPKCELIPDGPSIDPDVGLRCNSITLLNPTSPSSLSSLPPPSQLVAAYEACATGYRWLTLHTLPSYPTPPSPSSPIEPQHLPPTDENTYTGMVTSGESELMALTYGGVLLRWRKIGGVRKWVFDKWKVEVEADMDDSGVVALADGRIVTTGGTGSVKVWL